MHYIYISPSVQENVPTAIFSPFLPRRNKKSPTWQSFGKNWSGEARIFKRGSMRSSPSLSAEALPAPYLTKKSKRPWKSSETATPSIPIGKPALSVTRNPQARRLWRLISVPALTVSPSVYKVPRRRSFVFWDGRTIFPPSLPPTRRPESWALKISISI